VFNYGVLLFSQMVESLALFLDFFFFFFFVFRHGAFFFFSNIRPYDFFFFLPVSTAEGVFVST